MLTLILSLSKDEDGHQQFFGSLLASDQPAS